MQAVSSTSLLGTFSPYFFYPTAVRTSQSGQLTCSKVYESVNPRPSYIHFTSTVHVYIIATHQVWYMVETGMASLGTRTTVAASGCGWLTREPSVSDMAFLAAVERGRES